MLTLNTMRWHLDETPLLCHLDATLPRSLSKIKPTAERHSMCHGTVSKGVV